MHEYYFKIKKGEIEFEFSTSDKFTFEEQLSDWINGVVKGSYVAPPVVSQETKAEPKDLAPEYTKRSGFIEVKNLTSINEIQTPEFKDIGIIVEEEEESLTPTGEDFEKTLEEAVQNPKIEVVEKVEESSNFESYLHSFSPKSPLDYLIIAALFILNIENQERFSVKQLNAKLVPAGITPVTHAIIEEALEENLVKIIPDYTGAGDVTEYTLTDEGEGYFVE